MNFVEARDYLYSRRRLGMKYNLDRMISLLSRLGDPQKSFRTVHIVGTNGKGSTTALLAETCRQLGFVTGRTTSPHLLDYRERIAVDGRWIPPETVAGFVTMFRPLIEEHEATFFEVTTAMAAWHFRESGVEWAIAEAGLGGRLDATRAWHGAGTVFTGVDIEHSRILGSTRALIAREKVAVADPGTALVAARQHYRVEEVIAEAVLTNSLLRAYPVDGARSSLEGEHQARNAGLALSAARLLLGRTAADVDEAFAKACRSLEWPGRLDLRRGSPPILFDVAHNPQSLIRLCSYLSEGETPVAGVVGFLEDKPWRRMAAMLKGYIDPVVTTTPLSERLLPASRLALRFGELGSAATPVDRIEDAVALGRSLACGLLVVTGSFYVVGEAMLACWRRNWIDGPSGEEAQVLDTPGVMDGYDRQNPDPSGLTGTGGR
jgi:dihydrofolate synthase / folylpolyglutamate synthase